MSDALRQLAGHLRSRGPATRSRPAPLRIRRPASGQFAIVASTGRSPRSEVSARRVVTKAVVDRTRHPRQRLVAAPAAPSVDGAVGRSSHGREAMRHTEVACAADPSLLQIGRGHRLRARLLRSASTSAVDQSELSKRSRPTTWCRSVILRSSGRFFRIPIAKAGMLLGSASTPAARGGSGVRLPCSSKVVPHRERGRHGRRSFSGRGVPVAFPRDLATQAQANSFSVPVLLAGRSVSWLIRQHPATPRRFGQRSFYCFLAYCLFSAPTLEPRF